MKAQILRVIDTLLERNEDGTLAEITETTQLAAAKLLQDLSNEEAAMTEMLGCHPSNHVQAAKNFFREAQELRERIAELEKENTELRWDGTLNIAEDRIKVLEAQLAAQAEQEPTVWYDKSVGGFYLSLRSIPDHHAKTHEFVGLTETHIGLPP